MAASDPWLMRTYSGHSTARASNALYRLNLEKGQTGLSIAFDLPTQLGYDPDAPQASAEVGRVGVSVAHIGDMAELLEGIPVEKMNTSMTINATAPWLLALYIAYAESQGVDPHVLQGTTQNDIMKEYLSRGTFIFPPGPSLRLIVDMILYTVSEVPRFNPINICSYHLQEAGATPVQEVAYALATAVGVLDEVRKSDQIEPEQFPAVAGRISFFVNSGIRFIEETCKMRAFGQLWKRILMERYGITDPKLTRFRYGVQVNSLGLTEVQPENNVPRIVLETLGVTLSKSARARAIQLPAWNEALGLPRPEDQQWSLRIQQILAYETDLLEYEDIFDGSKVIAAKTQDIADAAWTELEEILALGGAFQAVGELKARLVRSQTERLRRIEAGEIKVVGVNCFTETAPSPLRSSFADLGKVGKDSLANQSEPVFHGDQLSQSTANSGDSWLSEEAMSFPFQRVDPAVEEELKRAVVAWRRNRDNDRVKEALTALRDAAISGKNIMPPSIALAHAGGTTGEWAGVLREVFGEYSAPTGVSSVVGLRGTDFTSLAQRASRMPGGPPRLLVAKPGLDGHSNGAEQIAVAARDAGFEVVYEGIRQSPDQIAAVARDEDVDIVGLSILSGSHKELVSLVVDRLARIGADPLIVVGGIIPRDDIPVLQEMGVVKVYTPKDYSLEQIMADLLTMCEARRSGDPFAEAEA